MAVAAIGTAMTAILQRVVDVVGHLIAGVGDKGLAFRMFAFAEKINGKTSGEGSSKGSESDGLRSLHNRCFPNGLQYQCQITGNL